MAQASGPASPTRGQTSEAEGTTILQACRKGTTKAVSLLKWEDKESFQMKEQDKNLQEQLNEEEMDDLPEKIIQSNDSKDDPRSQKKNGGMDQEDTRNV